MNRMAGMKPEELEAKAAMVTRFLKAMANPARLLVLCQLVDGEKSVGELERAVGLSQSALSQHLAVLRREKVVATRRAGQNIFYLLASSEAAAVMQTLYQVFCEEAASGGLVGRLGQRRRQAA
jgi:ArsR family transcriptional regulator, virulence genes transcriptional regulator